MKALPKFAGLACLLMTGVMVTAGDGVSVAQQTSGKTAHDARQMMSGKPEAPVEIRWLADGRDGRVVLEIVSAIDQVGAVVRLSVPGQDRLEPIQLPAAKAGEAQRVQWWLEAPAAHPPRVSVEVDTGRSRMPRNAVAPWSRGKNAGIRAEPDAGAGKRSAAPEKAESDEPAGRRERLAPLPAEQTIRPRENGSAQPD